MIDIKQPQQPQHAQLLQHQTPQHSSGAMVGAKPPALQPLPMQHQGQAQCNTAAMSATAAAQHCRNECYSGGATSGTAAIHPYQPAPHEEQARAVASAGLPTYRHEPTQGALEIELQRLEYQAARNQRRLLAYQRKISQYRAATRAGFVPHIPVEVFLYE